jgi:hypothetical protein
MTGTSFREMSAAAGTQMKRRQMESTNDNVETGRENMRFLLLAKRIPAFPSARMGTTPE